MSKPDFEKLAEEILSEGFLVYKEHLEHIESSSSQAIKSYYRNKIIKHHAEALQRTWDLAIDEAAKVSERWNLVECYVNEKHYVVGKEVSKAIRKLKTEKGA